jgi:hypothetical protein
VRPARRTLLTARAKTFETELAKGLEHREAWLAVRLCLLAQQVLVEKRLQPFARANGGSCCGDHRLGGLERVATDKDRKVPEQPLLFPLEQLVTPGDVVLLMSPQQLKIRDHLPGRVFETVWFRLGLG